MRKQWIVFVVTIFAALLMLSYSGCSKDDDSTTDPGAATSISANGTLAPTSRTQAQGTLFVSDQDGNPITGLTAANVVAKLKWGTPKVAVLDSVTGAVLLQTLSQSGKNIAAAMTMDYSSKHVCRARTIPLQNGISASGTWRAP